jgi:hydrogenase maturation protein HypF
MGAPLGISVRRAIGVEGIVQGVGFRPFVARLAIRHGLVGFVRNVTGGVSIEVEGEERSLEDFASDLQRVSPPGARIGRISCEPRTPRGGTQFTIEPSLALPGSSPAISPDVATCTDCRQELFDPANRRHRYSFTTCAGCGPRFTIVVSPPYDRERTSMGAFPLCGACRSEYEDPDDRRTHAEAISCPACGPRLRLLDKDGREIEVADPVVEAGRRLREGRLLAVKGLGGYHLACDASRDDVVGELRRRKGRDEKPFALLVADVPAARRQCEISPVEEELLRSPERPIVLLQRRNDAPIALGVAPGNPFLGLMLPYTPLHHLLVTEVGEAPLVLTSANASEEPIAYEDGEALRSLNGIADLFLTHDRAIQTRCDDSVARVVDGERLILRRSRGYAPTGLSLPVSCAAPTLALGGAFKATFALGRDREAILSHHLGDLECYEAYRAYVRSIELYERLFHVRPEVVVHDLHPDYPSTRYAFERGGVRRIAVQHHHAHMASCMAENSLVEPVIGVTFDGTGYGTDGTIWGGEFLIGDYRGFRRAAHFEDVPMPGGEAAIREPWRMAAAVLAKAGEDDALLRPRIPGRSLDLLRQLMNRGVNCPRTSSCGRLFDGVSSLLGVRDRVSYEGQAAIELEWLARKSSARGVYPVETARDAVAIAPIISGIARDLRAGVCPADVARRFHSTIVEAIRVVCVRLRDESGLDRVVLSGGCFMNEILLTEASASLQREAFRVYRHRQVPPNDGGLCLGQLAVAAAGGGHERCA